MPHALRLWDGFTIIPMHAAGRISFLLPFSHLQCLCCSRLFLPGEGAGDVDWDALHRLLLELQEQAKDAGTATDEGRV